MSGTPASPECCLKKLSIGQVFTWRAHSSRHSIFRTFGHSSTVRPTFRSLPAFSVMCVRRSRYDPQGNHLLRANSNSSPTPTSSQIIARRCKNGCSVDDGRRQRCEIVMVLNVSVTRPASPRCSSLTANRGRVWGLHYDEEIAAARVHCCRM